MCKCLNIAFQINLGFLALFLISYMETLYVFFLMFLLHQVFSPGVVTHKIIRRFTAAFLTN